MRSNATSIEHEIVARRDELVERRTHLLHARAEIIAELRSIDRSLSDCRATARFFGLTVDFPEDEREQYERIKTEHAHESRLRFYVDANKKVHAEIPQLEIAAPGTKDSAASDTTASPQPEAEKVEPKQRAVVRRPSVREVAISHLKAAGDGGLRAGKIRDFLEREYGLLLHEKTVGMTLYRLSKEGLAVREGQTWFFGPARASARSGEKVIETEQSTEH